jgi:hypothetical protein
MVSFYNLKPNKYGVIQLILNLYLAIISENKRFTKIIKKISLKREESEKKDQ